MSLNQSWDETPTRLYLNGPTLSVTSDPSSFTVNHEGSGSFVGVVTATFPSEITDAVSDGTITFQWYRKLEGESSFTALGAGSTFYSGQTSTTLSISHALSPDQHNSEYYVEAQYTPSAYGSVGSARSTGNAINEPITSGIATLSINPGLSIVTQPADSTAVLNSNTTFRVVPFLTDTTQGAVSYQWYLNGNPITTSTVQTTTTVSTITNKYTNSSTTNGLLQVVIPDDATDVQIEICGGSGASGGNDSNGTGGGSGYGRRATFSLPDGGRTLDLYIGTKASGQTRGGNSTSYDIVKGGNGSNGSPGAGGGSGSATLVYDNSVSDYILVAGGGGGGGGGSLNDSGTGGTNSGAFSSVSSLGTITTIGNSGPSNSGNGGGAGAGGGGKDPGAAGSNGVDVPPPPPPPPLPDRKSVV